MAVPRDELLGWIDASTERLLGTVRRRTDDDVRQPATLLVDLMSSASHFRDGAVSVPEPAWGGTVAVLRGLRFPAPQLLERRLVELELHHTDLDAGYGPRDWPAEFAAMEPAEPMRSQRRERAAAG